MCISYFGHQGANSENGFCCLTRDVYTSIYISGLTNENYDGYIQLEFDTIKDLPLPLVLFFANGHLLYICSGGTCDLLHLLVDFWVRVKVTALKYMKMLISESVLKIQFGLREEFEIWHTYSLGVAA